MFWCFGKLGLFLTVVVGLLAPAARAQVSDDVVRIGVLTDMSGPFADISGSGEIEAVRMAVEDFGGKVLGKPVEVVFADHQNRPDIGSAIARQWIDRERVDVVVGGPNSAVALAVQGLVSQNGRIFLNLGSAAADLSGKACSPTAFHWTTDTYSMSISAKAVLRDPDRRNWFLIVSDYAFGTALEREIRGLVSRAGGKIAGSVHVPLNTADFASYLLQAQTSGANTLGFVLVGHDLVNAVTQAREFGIGEPTLKMVALAANITDVQSIGLQTAQGLLVADSWYWDTNDETRQWAKRFAARTGGRMPTQEHAADYSAISHYLKAVAAAGTDDGAAVAREMRELPVQDFYVKGAKVREDGRLLRDFFLYRVRTPEASRDPRDVYSLVDTVPGVEAARPVAESECPLLRRMR